MVDTRSGRKHLLDDEIIDSLWLQGVSDSLSDEHRQHDRDGISQGIGQLEHNNSQGNCRSLSKNGRSNPDKHTTRGRRLR